MDRDLEQRPDGVLERAHAALRELLRVAVGVGHQRVELRAVDVSPLPSGVSIRSRGSDTSETVCPTGSIEATIIVSVRVGLPVAALVDADEQDVDPLARPRA